MPKNKEVEAWLQVYDNPMKPVVARVREIILAAPSFGYSIASVTDRLRSLSASTATLCLARKMDWTFWPPR